jgi:hypothetical protein
MELLISLSLSFAWTLFVYGNPILAGIVVLLTVLFFLFGNIAHKHLSQAIDVRQSDVQHYV